MKKTVLLIDKPLSEQHGGDKERGIFTQNCLKNHFDVTRIELLDHKNFPTRAANQFTIEPTNPFLPDSIKKLSQSGWKSLHNILNSTNIDFIFFRHMTPALIACQIHNNYSKIPIVYDLDMYHSRLMWLNWNLNRSIRNRYPLFQYIKFSLFEKFLFSKPFLFFLSNPIEKELILQNYSEKSNPAIFEIFPNTPNVIVNEKQEPNFQTNSNSKIHPHLNFPPIIPSHKEKYILFYGTLNSMVNEKAFLYLVQKIYPKIKQILKTYNCKIYIVGRNPTASYKANEWRRDDIKVIGPVENLKEYILHSQFIFLPLLSGTGTRTRILDCGMMGKPILTTPIGAEGLNFKAPDEILIGNTEQTLSDQVKWLLQNPKQADEIGKRAQMKCQNVYSHKVIENQLIKHMNDFFPFNCR